MMGGVERQILPLLEKKVVGSDAEKLKTERSFPCQEAHRQKLPTSCVNS